MLATAKKAFETEVSQLFQQARDLVRRHGKDRLKEVADLDGWRFHLNAKPLQPGIEVGNAGLPPELGVKVPPMLRRTYRVFKVLRAEWGPDRFIQAGDVAERWITACPKVEPNLGTIKQMLTVMRKKKVAYYSEDRGWVFGQPQGTLFPGPEECQPRVPLPRSQFIWVPGDLRDRTFVAVDSLTDAVFEVPEWRSDYIEVKDWKDRVKECPAVRAELIAREGRHVLVKLPTGERIYTRVLGDWHLAGRNSAEDRGEGDH